jgi:phosphoadenosine phosphosulfate reductase
MPLDHADAALRAEALNARYRHHAARDVLHHALSDDQVGRVALVSSFGAESVVLLHMVAVIDRALPVLFLETGMLFSETLAYQRAVTEHLGLVDVRLIRPHAGDDDGTLHRGDPDACCDLRKARPLQRALDRFDAWITGRKRFQGGRRAGMQFFEVEEATGRLKVNPLAHWTPADVRDYMENNRLPPHPLVARGYPSLGCAPCTTPVAPGEDARAGRWRDRGKDECGIHFANGRVVRGPAPREAA